MENVQVRPQSAKHRLKKKIKDKKDQRTGNIGGNLTGIPQLDNSNTDDIFSMIQNFQNILKSNPDMVNKVNSCVNSLMSNPDIMGKITSQINDQISSQTLESKSSGESSDAVSKES